MKPKYPRWKKEGEKLIFNSMSTAVLEGAAMYTGSISHIGYNNDS